MNKAKKELESIFTPPVFKNDEEKTRSAKLLNFILWTMIGLTLFYTITAPFTHDDPTPLLVTSILLFAFWIGGLIFNKKGFVQQTATVFVSTMWLVFTIIAVFGGGASSPSLMNYFIVIVVAAVLLSGKASLITAGMSALASLGLFIAESNGTLPEASLASTPTSTLAIIIGNLLMASVLLWLTSQSTQESSRRAQHELEERQAIEQELRFSEQKFSKAFHSSPDAVILSELESGRFIEVNDGFQEIYGYSREEAIGRTAVKLGLYHNPEDRNKLVQILREQENACNLEFAARHKSGAELTTLLSAELIEISGNPCLITIARDITERKREEETRAELSRMLEDSLNEIYVFDADTLCFIQVNTGARNNLGYTMEELRSMTPLDFKTDFTAQTFSELINPLRTGEKPKIIFETRHRRKNNTFYDVEAHLQKATFDGRPVFFAIILDITERKKAAEKLHQAQLVLESSPVVLFRWSPADGWPVELVSENVAQFGYTPEELLSGTTPYATIVHPSDLERVGHEVSEYSARGVDRFQQEYRILTKDGQVRWTYDQTVIERDTQGNIKHYQGTVMDITERKKSEDALHISEQNYREIFNATSDAIFIHDAKTGAVLDVNQPMLDMYGYTHEEALRLSVIDFSLGEPPYSQVKATQKIRQTLEEGPQLFEWVAKRSDGETFWVEVALRSSEIGGQSRVLAVVRDISERKRSEALVSLRLRLFEYAVDHFLDELLQKVLDEVGELTGSPIGFYHFVEPDQKTLSLQAWSTRTLKEFCRAEGQGMHYPIDEAGVWVDCVRERRVVIHNDYASLPHRKGLPDGHAHLTREMVVPILRHNRIVAILGVGNKLQDYTDRDAESVAYLADVAWELVERKQIEEELRVSEQKFSLAFRSSPDSVTLTELESGHLVEVNNGFQKVFGYSREEAIGHSTLELGLYQNPADREKMVQTIREQGSIQNLELTGRHKSGSQLIALLSAETIAISGKPYLVTITRDITERKRVEDEREKLIKELETKNAESETLRESAAAVASPLELNETVDRILDQLQRVVPYDSASIQLLEGDELEIIGGRGFPEGKDAIGMRFTFDEDDVAYPILKDGLPYIFYPNVQAVNDKFKGSEHKHILSWMAIPLYARGRLIGMFTLDGFSVDKFTKAHAEFALTFANQVAITLENSRLYTTLQSELAKSEELVTELESKNAELERFTYTASHDLKSPLITIRGFLGYLKQDAIDGNIERLTKDIERISEAAKKMQQLLDELLELSRIGRLMNEPEEVSFEAIAREAVSLVEGQLKDGNIKVKIGSELPNVHVDRGRLVEAVQNLVDNAAKFTKDQPHPIIEIGFREKDEERIFYVKDNGIGIDPKYHERIFGLFNKLDTSSDGTGVGLALVKRIVELHGGRIWIESKPGKGATFCFTLSANRTQRQENEVY